MSGKWVLFEGHPYWEWVMDTGEKKWIHAIDVIMSSTSNTNRDRYMVECYCKMVQIYDHFNIPRVPEDEFSARLDSQLLVWATWSI